MRKALGMILIIVLLLSLMTAVIFSLSKREKKTIVLEYWTHEDDAREELENRLIAEFESNNKNIKIKRVTYPSSELINVVPAAFYSNNGPSLFSLIQTSLPPLLEGGYLDEYPHGLEKAKNSYIRDVLDAAALNGSLYGLPMEYTSWVLYVNDDALSFIGINPDSSMLSTWEGIKEISEALVKSDDGVIVKRGFDFRYPYYLNFLIPMVNELGGGIEIVNGHYELKGESAWIQVFDFFKEWGPLYEGLGSPTYKNARTVFPESGAAMMLSGLYHEERLQNDNVDFKWSVHPFPTFKDGIDSGGAKYLHYWSVNAKLSKKEKKAAWAFIEFLSEHANEYLEEVGLIMPKTELFETLSQHDIPYIDIFKSDLEKCSFIFTGKSSETLRALLEDAINEIMLKDLDSTKCVERLSSALRMLPL